MAHPRIETGMYVTAKPPLDLLESFVSTARDQQLDSVIIWDHIQDFIAADIWDADLSWLAGGGGSPHDWYEFQVMLGYLAGKYPGVRLGVGVTEPFRRHPVVLAQAMLTLAHLSPHAPILGIGMGERLNTEPYGIEFTRAFSRLEEALQVIRRAFDTTEPFDFDGEHFHLDKAVLGLTAPGGRTPEIWIAAHGPRMLQLTGKYGDGWYPFAVASPDDYAARLEVVRDAARSAGRDPDAITPALHPITILAPTEEEASAMLDTRAIRFFGLLFPDEVWQLFGLRHPLGDGLRGFMDLMPETYDRAQLDAAIDAVPRQMVESLFWGTPEQVVTRLRGFGEAGLRHVVPILISPLVSQDAAAFSFGAFPAMAHALRTGAEVAVAT
jgi:phthiodiolone/phenolphthiodiolone dimycocerosates ketoreductase